MGKTWYGNAGIATSHDIGRLEAPAPLSPEASLLMALLADAVRVLLKRRGPLQAEAARWFLNLGTPATVTFRTVCDELDYAPGYFRRELGGRAYLTAVATGQPDAERLRRPGVVTLAHHTRLAIRPTGT